MMMTSEFEQERQHLSQAYTNAIVGGMTILQNFETEIEGTRYKARHLSGYWVLLSNTHEREITPRLPLTVPDGWSVIAIVEEGNMCRTLEYTHPSLTEETLYSIIAQACINKGEMTPISRRLAHFDMESKQAKEAGFNTVREYNAHQWDMKYGEGARARKLAEKRASQTAWARFMSWLIG